MELHAPGADSAALLNWLDVPTTGPQPPGAMPDGDRPPEQAKDDRARRQRARIVREAKRSLASCTAAMVLCGAVCLCYWWRMPKLREDDLKAAIACFPPQSVREIVTIRDVVLSYSGSNPVCVAIGLALLYIVMQTFAVPGTLWLSILSGSVYGPKLGLMLVSAMSTTGSCCCYYMSFFIGRPLVHAIWPKQLDAYGLEVEKRRQHLLNYIIFLRVTPVLPNTFISVASPIVGVPIGPFAMGTFIGCVPNHIFAVNAGNQLSDISSISDLYSLKLVMLGCIAGCTALVPVLLQYGHQKLAKKKVC
eukprot:evm.model.scf_1029.4 EVM.evm.TU.scf_1029.4   scf_1029:50260-54680(-)